MNDNFIKTINYLSTLKQIISDEESDLKWQIPFWKYYFY